MDNSNELKIKVSVAGTDKVKQEIKSVRQTFKDETAKIKSSFAGLSSGNTMMKGLKDMKRGFKGLADQAGKLTLVLGGAVVGGALHATKSFVDFEDQVANVRKTVGLSAEEAKKFGDEILKLAPKTRTSIESLVDIATIGGQLGITKDQIIPFTDSINKLNVALGDEFSGGAAQISNEMGILRQLFKDVKTDKVDQDMLHIGNAINLLGASGLATGEVIADFSTRIAGLTGGLGVGAGDVLGLSATLQELGVNAERGGSNVGRIYQIIAKNSDKVASVLKINGKNFKKLVNTDINEAFLTVAKRVKELGKNNTEFASLLDDLGLDAVGASEILQKLGGNVGLLEEKQKLANGALKETNSVMSEYDIKNNTTKGNLEKLGNTINATAIKVGGTLAPTFSALLEKVQPFIDENLPKLVSLLETDVIPKIKDAGKAIWNDFLQPILKWIKENPEVVAKLVDLVIKLGALNLALKGLKLIFGNVFTIFMGLGKFLLPLVVSGLISLGNVLVPAAAGAAGLSSVTAGLLGLAVVGTVLGWIAVIKTLADQYAELTNQVKRYNEASGVRAAVSQKGFDKASELQQQGKVPKTARTIEEIRAFQKGGEKELNKEKLSAIVNNAFELSKKGQITIEKRNQIISKAKKQYGMANGGILGGNSSSGDRIMFAGNSGEMVINQRDQSALFAFIKKLGSQPATTNNINTVNFGGSGRSRAQEVGLLNQLLLGM